MNILLDELVKTLIENKMVIIMFLQFLVHKSASYYVAYGRKSFKGFIRFLLGANVESKNELKG